MSNRSILVGLLTSFVAASIANADTSLLKKHCGKCHGGTDPKGDFSLGDLGDHPNDQSIDLWVNSLDFVQSGEMPPAKQSQLSDQERGKLTRFLWAGIRKHDEQSQRNLRTPPRRMNNRELKNSVADVLLIEDVGTHQPTASLIGDTLHNGFDTNGDALGMSEYHLEQYIDAFRKIVDATILTGPRPEAARVRVATSDLRMTSQSQRKRAERANRTVTSVDFLDPKHRIYFGNFESVPVSGRYRIKIRASGVDRGIYDSELTGIYHDDPIVLRVHLGDRTQDFHLPDAAVEVELDEWLAEGTHIQLSYPTDGLRNLGNGNFKFQFAIAHDHLRENNPDVFERVIKRQVPRAAARTAKNPRHWSHWTDHWQGPRPRVFDAEVTGPVYESWPSKRQIALLGDHPSAQNAAEILRPIASRAWRRDVRTTELEPIVRLVRSRAATLGDVEALKEGIVAILVSPSFLLLDPEHGESSDRFATKFSYLLKSTTPSGQLREAAANGELAEFDAILAEVKRLLANGEADEFVAEFPHAWLQLDRINFMAPDPERYPLYDRKRLSDDMVNEVLAFFRDAVERNVPVPDLLTSDYSFLNADLAKVYGVAGVQQDSELRRFTFTDGRRGGLLGMGAFLTLTADSLGTSPIHRAIYVMENFLGIHPSPPPADVNIAEPDVRSAKTIKEVLEAHRSDRTCASCHESIDPHGYAFENFDPVGAWRDAYTEQIAPRPGRAELARMMADDERRQKSGLEPLPKPWLNQPIPVDASSSFRNGSTYADITEFRQLMTTDVNRDRFVRCFVNKLLSYANGCEPDDFSEVEQIVSKSAEHDYRIVETIAAVIDSPLFREESLREE